MKVEGVRSRRQAYEPEPSKARPTADPKKPSLQAGWARLEHGNPGKVSFGVFGLPDATQPNGKGQSNTHSAVPAEAVTSTTPSQEADQLEAAILGSRAYRRLSGKARQYANQAVQLARHKPPGSAKGQRLYYLRKLETALNTPYLGKPGADGSYGRSTETEAINRSHVQTALVNEQLRHLVGADEATSEQEDAFRSAQNVRSRTGPDGTRFLVDATELDDIRIKVKVKLNGPAEDVAQMQKLEDAVERACEAPGYGIDIEFTDKAGPDVFEFETDFQQWPNAGVWASAPDILSHELHHRLGLDDRYDYIEAHADNTGMSVGTRLEWFVVQMNKPMMTARDEESKMHTGSKPLLSEDTCAVAFETPLDRGICQSIRREFDPPEVPQ